MLSSDSWPKDNWKNLVKVHLPSGRQAIYTKAAYWMTAADAIKYGLHIATCFNEGWQVLDYLAANRLRQATPEEIAQFDALPVLS